MSSNVYSKNDILQKLAQEGFFVDYLTLDSFLSKYKLEAIFEDETGTEFFDRTAYETLVSNVLKRPSSNISQPAPQPAPETLGTQREVVYEAPAQQIPQQQYQPYQQQYEHLQAPAMQQNAAVQNTVAQEEFDPYSADAAKILNRISLSDGSNVLDAINSDTQEAPKNDIDKSLGDIKWHNWQEVSADLRKNEKPPEAEIITSESKDVQEQTPVVNFGQDFQPTQQEYWQQPKNEPVSDNKTAELNYDMPLPEGAEETKPSLEPQVYQELMSAEEQDDDFDDIGLLSDSLQAQEKFQNYIVNELAKKNIDLQPKIENAFKLDVSEKTLNMVARAIAKKIARQVSQIFSADTRNNPKLAQIEEKNQMLEAKVNTLEEQNRKLKLLLMESNKNLNSYKPTMFGLYKFVRKKSPKKKK